MMQKAGVILIQATSLLIVRPLTLFIAADDLVSRSDKLFVIHSYF
jgi:hypothetical protein